MHMDYERARDREMKKLKPWEFQQEPTRQTTFGQYKPSVYILLFCPDSQSILKIFSFILDILVKDFRYISRYMASKYICFHQISVMCECDNFIALT